MQITIEPPSCYICRVEFNSENPPTRHKEEADLVHDKCLKTWLQTDPTCPICREPITVSWKSRIAVWMANATAVAVTVFATHWIATSIQKPKDGSSILPIPIACAMTALGTVGEISTVPLLRELPIIAGCWFGFTNCITSNFGWAAGYSAAALGWGASVLAQKVELIDLSAIRYGMGMAALASVTSWTGFFDPYIPPMIAGSLIAGSYAARVFNSEVYFSEDR